MRTQSLRSSPTLCDPMDQAHQNPLSMGFSQQNYWNGLSHPPPGDLPDPGIKPASPALTGRFFTTEPAAEPYINHTTQQFPSGCI